MSYKTRRKPEIELQTVNDSKTGDLEVICFSMMAIMVFIMGFVTFIK